MHRYTPAHISAFKRKHTHRFRSLVALLFANVAFGLLQAAQSQPAHAKETSENPTPPNIVLILADDLGIYDLGCYGRADHHTPNLDRLASEGLHYTSAYCGLSICSASRAALLTSKSPARLHLTSYLPGRADAPSQRLRHPRIEPALIPSTQTLAEVLQRAGYTTGIFGKWHLGGGDSAPLKQGFDIAFEPPGNGDPNTTGGKNEFLITEKAIEFINTHSNAENPQSTKPYFCYVPHHSPHITLNERKERIDANSSAWNPLYAATIEALDESIGKLLQAIEASPQANNTIVIFTSDNGGLHVPELHPDPVTHNGPFRAGKGYLYEGGLRVPMIVRWPNVIGSNQRLDAPISLMDIMPTLLESAGIEVARSVGPVDGVSQLTTWKSKANEQTPPETSSERSFYWHFPHYTNQGSKPAGAVRKGNWKWIEDYENQSGELFDLEQDPSEANNLAKDHPQIAQSMHKALENWKRSVAAQECVPNPSVNPELNLAIYSARNASTLRGQHLKPSDIGKDWKEWREQLNQAIAGTPTLLKNTPSGIILTAAESTPHGKRIRYEPETYKNVVGYWTEVDDWVEWNTTIPVDGTYRLEIHCGCGAGNGGSLVNVEIENNSQVQTVPWTVRDTGHFQNIVIEQLDDLKLTAGSAILRVKPQKKAAAAVVDIREIHLIPLDAPRKK
jgi:arylsulfatase A-like enzyme